jgi:hypothetical protein
MASTKAPLFGLDASGTIAGALVFSKWRGRTYVRRHAIPKNPRSGLQVGMRQVMKWTTQDYKNLSTAQKETWADLAAVDNITLLNAQVRNNQKRARLNQGWMQTADATPGTTPDAPTSPTTAEAAKTLILSWTRPVTNQGDYTAAIYMDTTTGFTPDISNLVGIVVVTSETITIPNLTTGTEYFWVVRETNVDGEFGADSTESSGTPT